MVLLVAVVIGFAALGWYRAGRRGGTRADRIQYAFAHAIPALLGMLALQILAIHLGVLL